MRAHSKRNPSAGIRPHGHLRILAPNEEIITRLRVHNRVVSAGDEAAVGFA